MVKQPYLLTNFAARTILDGQYSRLMLTVTIFWRQSVSSYNDFNVLLTDTQHLLIDLLVTSYSLVNIIPFIETFNQPFTAILISL